MRLDISPHIEHAFIREAHLVQKTIIASKRRAGISRFECLAKIARQKIAAHREFYSPMQEAYDGWLSFPFPTRIEIPEPPHPPELETTDIQGDVWIIDEKLFHVIDDLQTRLGKWLASNE